MKKYTTVTISGIITAIGKEISPGYVEKVIETMLPTDEELANMTDEQEQEWIADNNKRMEAVCNYMNSNPDI